MLSSETPTSPEPISRNWSPDVSQIHSTPRESLSLLTDEERAIYRKWRRGTLIFYGALATVLAVFLTIGPIDTSSKSGGNAVYSALDPVRHAAPR
jgi:hypothetical protein